MFSLELGLIHVLFVNDIFLFAKAQVSECLQVLNLVTKLCEYSSQLINLKNLN